jgi:hypothetical protein
VLGRGKEIREENAVALYITNRAPQRVNRLQHIMSYPIETNTTTALLKAEIPVHEKREN